MNASLSPAVPRPSAEVAGPSFYQKAAGMLLAVGTVTSVADAQIVFFQGSVTDTGNIAPSGSTVSLQIGTNFASIAYGFVKGIGTLSLPNDSLSGFFRLSGAPTVGPSNTFGAPGSEVNFYIGGTPQNNAVASADNFIGFQFTSSAVNGGNPVFGWAEITIPVGSPESGARIVEWAYQSNGTSIVLGDTGPIPEPSSLALLAGAAVGGIACFHRFRKRRRQAEDAPAAG